MKRTSTASRLTTLVGLALSLLFVAGPGLAGGSITVVGWGGALSKAESEAMEKPFAKKFGVEVRPETYNGGLAEVKAQVETNKVVWNVVDGNIAESQRGCDEGILERIDSTSLPPAPDGTPASKDFLPGALQECGVANYIWSTVVAYDASKFNGKNPKTIADFFDVDQFPGKRGLRKSPIANMEWALMADGVPTQQVYKVLATEEGMERAFRVLDRIKDDVIWWEAGAQPPQLLADGEVAMTSAYNGRLYNAIVQEKKPFVIIWDGQVWDYGLFIIPAKSPNKAEAMDYIKFATSTQPLADLTQYISYGPTRRSSLKVIPEEIKKHLPNAPENFGNALQADGDFWTDYGDELNERFANWLAR